MFLSAAAVTQARANHESVQTQLRELLNVVVGDEDARAEPNTGLRCLFCDHAYGDPTGRDKNWCKVKASCGCSGVGDLCAQGQVHNSPVTFVYGCGLQGEKCYRCRQNN